MLCLFYALAAIAAASSLSARDGLTLSKSKFFNLQINQTRTPIQEKFIALNGQSASKFRRGPLSNAISVTPGPTEDDEDADSSVSVGATFWQEATEGGPGITSPLIINQETGGVLLDALYLDAPSDAPNLFSVGLVATEDSPPPHFAVEAGMLTLPGPPGGVDGARLLLCDHQILAPGFPQYRFHVFVPSEVQDDWSFIEDYVFEACADVDLIATCVDEDSLPPGIEDYVRGAAVEVECY